MSNLNNKDRLSKAHHSNLYLAMTIALSLCSVASLIQILGVLTSEGVILFAAIPILTFAFSVTSVIAMFKAYSMKGQQGAVSSDNVNLLTIFLRWKQFQAGLITTIVGIVTGLTILLSIGLVKVGNIVQGEASSMGATLGSLGATSFGSGMEAVGDLFQKGTAVVLITTLLIAAALIFCCVTMLIAYKRSRKCYQSIAGKAYFGKKPPVVAMYIFGGLDVLIGLGTIKMAWASGLSSIGGGMYLILLGVFLGNYYKNKPIK